MNTNESISRRHFLAASGTILAGSALLNPLSAINAKVVSSTPPAAKLKLAMVGTGSRGTSMWGSDLMRRYADKIEFVGLCDMNPGRVEAGKEIINANCRTFSDLQNPMSAFEKMMKETKPDLLIVTTVDATHRDYIVRGMELGVNVLTEKPMCTDEIQIQQILDAEKRTGKKTLVTHNARYSALLARLWEVLRAGEIGQLQSVTLDWYLDTSHGADYFRRWHRLMEKSGSLLLHKSSHHFDMMNWLIDSDPISVYASGSLDHYGRNGALRAENCRTCPHTAQCKFYWQIERPAMSSEMRDAAGVNRQAPQPENPYRKLYLNCEKYDGYLRDGCVFKNDINIFDKTAATIRYANGVHLAYSFTAYAPYEGYSVVFNGTKGRITLVSDANPALPRKEQGEFIMHKQFSKFETIQVPRATGTHGGSDDLLRDQIFIPSTPDPYKQCAGTRDGAFTCLIGIAARKSIASGQPIQIAGLTSLIPQAQKEYQRDILKINN